MPTPTTTKMIPAWLTPALIQVIAQATSEFVIFMMELVRKQMAGQKLTDEDFKHSVRKKLRQQVVWEAAKAARGGK